MVRVARVHPDSIATELGIVPGTELLTVNGRELGDFLDWEFLTADDELVIEARSPDGEAVVYEVERPEGFLVEHEEADMTLDRVPLADAVQRVFDGDIRNAIAVVGLLAAAQVRAGAPRLRPVDAD